ncbi:MAG: hypothetical protein CML67_03950 [Rhodobacteraceae bacterium]|nr:hypothetical protein [Paracoccaceae bacterium]
MVEDTPDSTSDVPDASKGEPVISTGALARTVTSAAKAGNPPDTAMVAIVGSISITSPLAPALAMAQLSEPATVPLPSSVASVTR